MSYSIHLSRDKTCIWYRNSVNYYLDNYQDYYGGKSIVSYEKMFNVRLITASNGSVIRVDFPSEADATLFLLRWS